MTKQFTKGDAVYLLQNWDHRGVVSITPAIVYACGKKRLVLTHAVTGEELGRHFLPTSAQHCFGLVIPETDRAAVEATALRLAADILIHEREQIARRLACGGGAAYDALIIRERDRLGEPAALWRE
jgi:hypothetical protein